MQLKAEKLEEEIDRMRLTVRILPLCHLHQRSD
jgi:hypothetical protein